MRASEILSEVSLKGFGDYAKKAQMDKALSQMGSAFAASPEDREKNLAKAARREKGLAMHKTRVEKHWAEKNARDAAEREQSIRDKFAGVDIDAEIERLQPALKKAYHDYQYGARNTYSQAHDEYNRISAKIRELEHAKKVLSESTKDDQKPRNFVAKNAKMGGAGAHRDKKKEQKQGDEKHKGKELSQQLSEDPTIGATSSANIGSVENPHIAIGKPNKSYTGSPGKSGTKAPKTPKVTQAKNKDGTAKNALDMKGTSIFGGKTLKRS